MAERPGFMVYFAEWRPLLKLDDATLARLFRASADYTQYGIVPDFDGMEAIVWGMLTPKLDRDEKQYRKSVLHSQYMVYCRNASQEERLSEEEWTERQLSTTNSNCQLLTVTGSNQLQQQLQPQLQPHPQYQLQPQGQGQQQGDRGEERGEGAYPSAGIDSLHSLYLQAMERGDMTEACTLGNKLFARGYMVDRKTGELTRREKDG